MKRISLLVTFLIELCWSIIAGENKQVTRRLEERYGNAYFFDSGYYSVGGSSSNGKYPDKPGMCDLNGNVVVPPGIYDYVYSISNFSIQQYVEVKLNNLYGIYDVKNKKIIIPVKFKLIVWHDTYYSAEMDDAYAIYDKYGNLLVEGPYSNIRYYQLQESDYCEVESKDENNGRKIGLIDRSGRTVLPAVYQSIRYHADINACEVEDGGKWGVVDLNNNLLVPIKYDDIRTYAYRDYGVYSVVNNNKEGLNNGKEIVPPVYDKINYWGFKENAMRAKMSGYWGVIDSVGQILLPFEYDSIFPANNEYWCACKKQRYGYIDKKTYEMVIPFKYEEASAFQKDIARVKVNGQWELLPDPRKTSKSVTSAPSGKKKVVSTYPAPSSDVDMNIPQTKRKAENTFAFIIANENYQVAKVPYALNDGWIFEQYCKQSLGIPEKQVFLYEDATGGNIIACIEKLKEIANAYEGEAIVIFYYAGHAFPDEKDNTAYLLPIDGNSQNIATAYSLKKLYAEFNSVSIKKLFCFIDACFSGTTRDDDMLIAGRGVAVKVKEDVPQGNMVVFTSATGAETAHSYEEKGHGLFTYYLLKDLQQTQGDVSLGSLTEYVRKEVRKKSVLVNEKLQTPTVIPSAEATDWQNWKLK